MTKLQAIRGMHDILPEQSPNWQYLEQCLQQVAGRFGYRQLRLPVLEHTGLFQRCIGEATDIVAKEMYSFEDRNGDNLSLRPEGTAGCVRAAEQHGLLYNQQQRLWYQGPMFRHERPQKGRYRQFHQFGVEAFGMAGPDIDAELIQLAAELWRTLGLDSHLQLEINNIGAAADRKSYGAALAAFLAGKAELLDADARQRIHSNPLRVLDSKNSQVQAALGEAPELADFVGQQSRQHYRQLQQLLQVLGIAFVENPRLVRGLDYYNNCVFEWTTRELGAQGTVCGGGRYDGLVAQLGGKPNFACGFAIGIERLVLLLDGLQKIPADAHQALDVYIVADQSLAAWSLQLAATIRRQHPRLGVISHCGGGKPNSQIKRAYRLGASVVVIVEQPEPDSAPPSARIRRLTDSAQSDPLALAVIADHLAEFL